MGTWDTPRSDIAGAVFVAGGWELELELEE